MRTPENPFRRYANYAGRTMDESSPPVEKSIVEQNLARKKPQVGEKRPFYVRDNPGALGMFKPPTALNGCIVEVTGIDEHGNVTCKFNLEDPVVKEVHENSGLETYTSNIRYLFDGPK